MRYFIYAAFAVFTIFCIIIAVSNQETVDLSLHPLPWTIQGIPEYLLVFLGIFIGLGAGWIVAISSSFKHRRSRRQLERQVRDLESELKSLSNRPVRETKNPEIKQQK
ncbi:LapA family protein [Emcibacter nanhaiensis]|uniref:LapA family protein n=1 Tax=Emcibacter nanhaiensis TaxID=1505037 RepID=A0A501PMX1_9PROT|nr:LapA family protein [Emcibacter nanhaiensis]TPD61850.1 LapA family protein [Emcibacter nanhaiensis]